MELYRREWDNRFVRFCNNSISVFMMKQSKTGLDRFCLFVCLISILCERERVSTVVLASIIILDKEVVPLRLSL